MKSLVRLKNLYNGTQCGFLQVHEKSNKILFAKLPQYSVTS